METPEGFGTCSTCQILASRCFDNRSFIVSNFSFYQSRRERLLGGLFVVGMETLVGLRYQIPSIPTVTLPSFLFTLHYL